MASAFRSLLPLLFAASVCLAAPPSFFQSKKYDQGAYGQYVTQGFVTTDVIAPLSNVVRPFTNCDDGSYYFVALRGWIPDATLYILDVNGSMVWAPDQSYGEVYNFQVQHFRGEPYLVFWAGNDAIGGHGAGEYHMLNKHYEEVRVIKGANGLDGDLHSFTFTRDDTAVFTLYDIHEVDITAIRPLNPKAYIWDSLFQEIDMDTGEALFEWRASDHFAPDQSYYALNEATQSDPWDFFHINCVEKDDLGNYLISSRHTRTIAYISGTTGEVLWRLGGKSNSFEDLSNGTATSSVGQHDAHWTADHTAITFFDNRGDWLEKVDSESRGVRVVLDTNKMTARVDRFYKSPDQIYSASQGSYQTLPNGNVLIGYGDNGATTEFSADGQALCETHYMPAQDFGTGNVQSYRNLKFNWTGIPYSNPVLALQPQAETLHMSWMGSTETRGWLLQHSADEGGVYESLTKVDRTGFETKFAMPAGLCVGRFVRAIALDAQSQPLATSAPVDLGVLENPCSEGNEEEQQQQQQDVDDGSSGVGGGGGGDDPVLDEGHKETESHLPQEHEEEDDDDDDDDDDEMTPQVHGEMKADADDAQLLLGFAFFALLSALLVTWLAAGKRLRLGPLAKRTRALKAETAGFAVPSAAAGLFGRTPRSSTPGGGGGGSGGGGRKKSWWRRSDGRRTDAAERGQGEEDNMLSDVEIDEENDGMVDQHAFLSNR